MPRKNNLLTVYDWPKLTAGKLHRGKVKGIRLEKTPSRLHVTIENLDSDQLGRIHELVLPLPVRPGNHACTFLAACGIDATAVGSTVDLDRVTNVITGMRFRGLGPDGAEEFDFEPISTAPADDGDTSTTTEKEVRPAKRG